MGRGNIEDGTVFMIQPADSAVAITPNDDADLETPTRGIYVGTYGDLKVRTIDGNDVTFVGLTAGVIHPIRVRRVFSTGTTADDIVGVT